MGAKRFQLGDCIQLELVEVNDQGVTFVMRPPQYDAHSFSLELVNFTGRITIESLSTGLMVDEESMLERPLLRLSPAIEIETPMGHQDARVARHEPFSQALGGLQSPQSSSVSAAKKVIEELSLIPTPPRPPTPANGVSENIPLPPPDRPFPRGTPTSSVDSFDDLIADHDVSETKWTAPTPTRSNRSSNGHPDESHNGEETPSPIGGSGLNLFRSILRRNKSAEDRSPHKDEYTSASDRSIHYSISIDEDGNKLRGKALFRRAVQHVIATNDFRLKRSGSADSGSSFAQASHVRKMSGNWGNLLYLAAARNQFKSHIREKRQEVRELPTLVPVDDEPTKLHELCNLPEITLSDLQDELERNPHAVSVQDSNGRLPLHVLGDNDRLVTTPIGRQTATSFCWTLMHAYPLGITTRDNLGHMPFVGVIEDWIHYTYSQHRKKQLRNGSLIGAHTTAATNAVADTAAAAWSKVINVKNATGMKGSVVRNSLSMPVEKANPSLSKWSVVARDVNRRGKSNTELASWGKSSAKGSDRSVVGSDRTPSSQDVRESTMRRRSEINSYSQRAHPRVEMWECVEWCLEVLSMAMDELAGKSGGLYKSRKAALIHHTVKDRQARASLADHIIEIIPCFVKTILLLEDDIADTRKKIMKLSVFRRILLCKDSVGPWIIHMLQKRSGIASRRGIDYLCLVSEVTPSDFVGGYKTILPPDTDAFFEVRKSIFEKIEMLDGIIASLVILDRREIERAAATAAVWNIMTNNLRRPFVLGLVLIDFVLHITLMLAFRRDVTLAREDEAALGNVPTQVVLFISSHYFIRKLCEGLNLFRVSPKVFRSYFLNIWTAFDFISIILVLAAVSWNDNNPNQYRQGLNSLIVGLLWIKVLGFLKVVNKEMSTFILSLIQILRDLRYFMIVMAVIVFMFGDMMHIAVSTKDDGQYCIVNAGDLSDPEQDFCDVSGYDMYLRVYSLLLGDFELSDYKNTDGLTSLFVIFTLIGVVILLNVLIAVISDSYERAKIESVNLFGRARVLFVAQNDAVESFLRPGSDVMADLGQYETTSKKALVVATRIFRYLVLVAIITTAMSAEIFLATRAYELIRAGNYQVLTLSLVVALTFVLTASIFVVLNFAIHGLVRNHFPGWAVRILDNTDLCSRYIVKRLATSLFGLSENDFGQSDFGEGEEEWLGRLSYMERVFETSLEDTRQEIKNEILGFEKRLYEHNMMQSQEQNYERETSGKTDS